MGKKGRNKSLHRERNKGKAQESSQPGDGMDNLALSRPAKAIARDSKEFDHMLRKESLQNAVEKLTRSGETFLDMQSLFASLSTQKLAVRKHIREIRDDFEETKACSGKQSL